MVQKFALLLLIAFLRSCVVVPMFDVREKLVFLRLRKNLLLLQA